jgi:DNA-directed RNA polymerase specialized sigma24 family protein
VVDVESLFREHDPQLYRALRRRFDTSVPDALIEDACASAWTIAWAHREGIRDENPLGWLVTVARHEALALLRKRGREVCSEGLLELAGAEHDPDTITEARECLALLAELNPNQGLALGLQASGPSYSDIAALTGKTLAWTNRHITEGRARLRKLASAA